MGYVRLYVSTLALISLFMVQRVELREDKDCSDNLSKCQKIDISIDAMVPGLSSSSEPRKKRNFLSNEFTANMIGRRLAGPILDAIYEEDEESPWLEAPIGDLFSMFIQTGGKAIEGDKYLGFAKPKVTKKPAQQFKPTENSLDDVIYDDNGIGDVGSATQVGGNNKVKKPGSVSSSSGYENEDDDGIVNIPNKQSAKPSSRKDLAVEAKQVRKKGRSYYREEPRAESKQPRGRPPNRHHQIPTAREDYSDYDYDGSYPYQYQHPYEAMPYTPKYYPNTEMNINRRSPRRRGKNRPIYRDEFGDPADYILYPSLYQRPRVQSTKWNIPPLYEHASEGGRLPPFRRRADVTNSYSLNNHQIVGKSHYNHAYDNRKKTQIHSFSYDQDQQGPKGFSESLEELPINPRFGAPQGDHLDAEYLDNEYDSIEDL